MYTTEYYHSAVFDESSGCNNRVCCRGYKKVGDTCVGQYLETHNNNDNDKTNNNMDNNKTGNNLYTTVIM